MTDNTLATTEVTDTTDQTNNQAEKTYTQKEVDDMMARTKSSVTKKIASKYEDLGDPDTIREVLQAHQKREQENAMKRGDFDKIVSDLASKKDAEIQKRDKIIEEFKLNSPIIDAAAKLRAVNPQQVQSLVRDRVRLNSEGDVEVLDNTGKVKYNDAGQPFTVEGLIQEFLTENPHFVSATPSTSASRSSIGHNGAGTVDISKLDMKNPEHRKLYSESRKTR